MGLHMEGELVHVVQEDRAISGLLEPTRERTSRVSKELRPQDCLGHSSAVDSEECTAALAPLVDQSSDQVLADAGFSGDQDLHGHRRDEVDLMIDLSQ
jgi:hypothetical protein